MENLDEILKRLQQTRIANGSARRDNRPDVERRHIPGGCCG